MTTFILIPGAGGAAWYWHRVVALLEAGGHEAIAVDLPGPDPHAGLAEYADVVLNTIADRTEVVLVGMSLGGFTAAVVAARVPLRALVFVNAMIPNAGETAGAWWANVGWDEARRAAAIAGGYDPEFDLNQYFLHDVPAEVAAAGEQHQREESEAIFASACEFQAWPTTDIRVVTGAEDRFFPAALQRRVAAERVGREVALLPGGHLLALSQPAALSAYLERVG